MARFHAVATNIWQDQRFLSCDDRARNIFLALATSPLRTTVPGILGTGPSALAEQLHRSTSDVMEGLRRLTEVGLVQYDELNRVMRTTVIWDVCKNQFVLQSWYRTWRDSVSSASPLKLAHLPLISLQVPLETPKMNTAWQGTFMPHLEAYVQELVILSGRLPDDLDQLADRGAVRAAFVAQLGTLVKQNALHEPGEVVPHVPTRPAVQDPEVGTPPPHTPPEKIENRNRNTTVSTTVSRQSNTAKPVGFRTHTHFTKNPETVSRLSPVKPDQLTLPLPEPAESIRLLPPGAHLHVLETVSGSKETQGDSQSPRGSAGGNRRGKGRSGGRTTRDSSTPAKPPSRGRQGSGMASQSTGGAWLTRIK